MEKESPRFSFASTCPNIHHVSSDLRTEAAHISSKRNCDFIAGHWCDNIPDTMISFFLGIYVRDLAPARVGAVEADAAAIESPRGREAIQAIGRSGR